MGKIGIIENGSIKAGKKDRNNSLSRLLQKEQIRNKVQKTHSENDNGMLISDIEPIIPSQSAASSGTVKNISEYVLMIIDDSDFERKSIRSMQYSKAFNRLLFWSNKAFSIRDEVNIRSKSISPSDNEDFKYKLVYNFIFEI